jgi:hypothetical protein
MYEKIRAPQWCSYFDTCDSTAGLAWCKLGVRQLNKNRLIIQMDLLSVVTQVGIRWDPKGFFHRLKPLMQSPFAFWTTAAPELLTWERESKNIKVYQR